MIPLKLFEAVLPVRVLSLELKSKIPLKKPVTLQSLTVTPVLPLRRMPVPEPDPITSKLAQSRVMLSAIIMLVPLQSAVRVVVIVMALGQVAP